MSVDIDIIGSRRGVDWRMGKLTSCSGVVGGGISMKMCGVISRYQSKRARKRVTQSKLSNNDAMKLLVN